MPRRFFQRVLPDPKEIRDASYVSPLRGFIDNRQLWTTKRRNVVLGLGIGIFCGFQPIPAHTMLAVLLAIWWKANLPMSIVATLFNNPITMFPMYFLGYKVGCVILGVPDLEVPPDASKMDWIKNLIANSWQPIYLGCFVTGLVLALIGSLGLNQFWKWAVLKRRRNRLLRTDESKRLEQDNVEYKKKIK
ncbi:MAG: DUF2062 domain-containing protein [Gammaproteobacteria bacterium]|nr:DUF2062 domain-containing protein [Gammaproteobacteria bacterium]NNC98415.1 DUF2062 domain-containing protein [Gammaproteobacteria bacterium]NNM13891.1 DUF2062 domain-containing protein [Gammaproteobacteria bacterium]